MVKWINHRGVERLTLKIIEVVNFKTEAVWDVTAPSMNLKS